MFSSGLIIALSSECHPFLFLLTHVKHVNNFEMVAVHLVTLWQQCVLSR